MKEGGNFTRLGLSEGRKGRVRFLFVPLWRIAWGNALKLMVLWLHWPIVGPPVPRKPWAKGTMKPLIEHISDVFMPKTTREYKPELHPFDFDRATGQLLLALCTRHLPHLPGSSLHSFRVFISSCPMRFSCKASSRSTG